MQGMTEEERAAKRTLTSSTPSVLYTAAQQTADWGAPLGPDLNRPGFTGE